MVAELGQSILTREPSHPYSVCTDRLAGSGENELLRKGIIGIMVIMGIMGNMNIMSIMGWISRTWQRDRR